METFSTLFARVSRGSKEIFERKLQQYGVHVGQQFLLEQLWASPEGLTVGELASRLDVEAPSITRTVVRMAKQGLVTKHTHPLDARQVIVRLTPRGKDLEQSIPHALAEAEAHLLAGVSDIERALLMRVFKQMLANVEHEEV